LLDATFALPTLERQLVEYVNSPLANDKEFDLAGVPMISKAQEEDERRRLHTQDIISPSTPSVSAGATLGANGASGSPSLASIGSTSTPHHHFAGSLDQQAVYAEQLAQIPAFQAFGTLFKSSSKPVPLTESETEYVVHCVKHTFARHVIFQFNCTNTLNDQLLENVHMVMQPMDDAPLVQVVEVPAPKLEYNVPGYIYVAFEQEDPEDLAVGKLKYLEKSMGQQQAELTLTH
jgi:coatomer protein complex subunit gamma